MGNPLLVSGLILCAIAFILVDLVFRPKPRRHDDPCLHRQGMAREDTWLASDPVVFRHRPGRALEWHLGGVAWYLAAKPDPGHDCQPQTCGITETLQHSDRCACGAMRFGVWGAWERRNSRA